MTPQVVYADAPACKRVSLLGVLNVLRDGLPVTTAYAQLLKSRTGRQPYYDVA